MKTWQLMLFLVVVACILRYNGATYAENFIALFVVYIANEVWEVKKCLKSRSQTERK